MTQPRLIAPGAVYLVTRRVIRRHHLFAPDPRMKRIFLYVLAVAAARTGVRVHAAVLMSTHEHLVISDPDERLPDFLQYLHRHVALATKVLRRWEGPVWDHEQPNVVELRTPRAVVDKIAYAIANPVAAGLVPRAHEWPGVTTRPSELGTARWRVERPDEYFKANDDKWPAYAEVDLELPRAATELGVTDERFQELVADEVSALEQAARDSARELGRPFLGADRCAKLSPFVRARSWEPVRSRTPAVAVGRGDPDALREAIARLRAFRAAYRDALASWRAGLRETVFPAGTWLMRHLHGVSTESSMPAAA